MKKENVFMKRKVLQLEEFEEDFEGHMMQTVRMVLYI